MSLWDVERGFAASSSTTEQTEAGDKKRKLGSKGGKDALMEGEIWRAKNVSRVASLPPFPRLFFSFFPSRVLTTHLSLDNIPV